MENNEFISASEKLNAFIDGELDAAESGTLFYEMASNPELQDEMKELLLIKNSFKNKMVTPPPALKNKVFAGLGMANSKNNAGKVAAGILFLSFLKRHYLSIVLGLALVFVGYFAFSPDDENQITNKNAIPISNSYDSTPSESDISNTSSNSEQNIAVSNVIPAKTTKKSAAKQSTKNAEAITEQIQNIAVANDESSDVYKINSSNFANNGLQFTTKRQKYDLMNWIYSEKVANILGNFSIQFRVADGTSYPSPNIPTNTGIINDFAVSVLYSFNKNSSIGVEFGRENFLMEFEGYEGDLLYRYPQSFNALNWGAFYQYQFNQFSIAESLIPYSRIFVGGTNVGPLARLSLGANYLLTENVSINASADYGILVYSHLGNYFNTQKLSWSIGLSLGL